MKLPGLELSFEQLPAPLPIARARVTRDDWSRAAQAAAGGGGRLVALWGSDRHGGDHQGSNGQGGDRAGGASGRFAMCAAYALRDGLAWIDLALDGESPDYPDLSAVFPAATRMQRAIADTLGIACTNAGDTRPWLDHGVWPAAAPLLRGGASAPAADAAPQAQAQAQAQTTTQTQPPDYRFVRVAGDGVHEIAVGPVHAGIIEPGHFRFSVVGEKVLRLEERLGQHRRHTHRHRLRLRFTQRQTDRHEVTPHLPVDGEQRRQCVLHRQRTRGDLRAHKHTHHLGDGRTRAQDRRAVPPCRQSRPSS